MNTIFTHRPVAGVSVGAFSEGNKLFIAFALVNDGTSRNGFFWEDRHDAFSRATARAIINGRIEGMMKPSGRFVAEVLGQPLIEQPSVQKFGLTFATDMSDRQFIAAFRETFKPTVDESDEFLSDVTTFGDLEESAIEVRLRPTATSIVERLESLAMEIITNNNVSV